MDKDYRGKVAMLVVLLLVLGSIFISRLLALFFIAPQLVAMVTTFILVINLM